MRRICKILYGGGNGTIEPSLNYWCGPRARRERLLDELVPDARRHIAHHVPGGAVIIVADPHAVTSGANPSQIRQNNAVELGSGICFSATGGASRLPYHLGSTRLTGRSRACTDLGHRNGCTRKPVG